MDICDRHVTTEGYLKLHLHERNVQNSCGDLTPWHSALPQFVVVNSGKASPRLLTITLRKLFGILKIEQNTISEQLLLYLFSSLTKDVKATQMLAAFNTGKPLQQCRTGGEPWSSAIGGWVQSDPTPSAFTGTKMIVMLPGRQYSGRRGASAKRTSL